MATYLSIFLVVEVVVGVGQNEFLHGEAGLGIVSLVQVQVAQLEPRVVVTHVPDKTHIMLFFSRKPSPKYGPNPF